MNMLLIEDEHRIADFVTKGLTSAGCTVRHVDNGEAGLQASVEDEPDLVLLDVMLPKPNGFEVLKRMRSQHLLTPVIVPVMQRSCRLKATSLHRMLNRRHPIRSTTSTRWGSG